MDLIKTDICVIGAGSGGLSVAAGAVQMGARVVLLEGAEMGGDCLNAGCIPSKAFIAAAKAAQAMRSGAKFGITPVEPEIDYGAVKDYVAKVVATIAPVDSEERFAGLGVRVIREWGRFVGPNEVEAGAYRIKARRFVIAVGSRPLVPPIPGLQDVAVLTNETIFALREKPKHLIIIGGGPIGMEMAQAHRRLGSAVTVIEGAQALGRDDPELAAVVLESLRSEGVDIIENAPVTGVTGEADNITVSLQDGRDVHGSHLLLAVGRTVNLDGLNLEAAGVAYERKGVTVDASLRTSNRRVYAVGDAAGGLQFTHVAGYHAGLIIRQLVMGLPAKNTVHHIPWATYTEPELAQVGLTEVEARKEHGSSVTVLRQEFEHNDRAQAEGKTKGLLKVMVVKGRPVGVSIAGPMAGELAGTWAFAIASKAKMSSIAGMVAPYPTLGEISKRAAGSYFTPALFESPKLKTYVRFVQRFIP